MIGLGSDKKTFWPEDVCVLFSSQKIRICAIVVKDCCQATTQPGEGDKKFGAKMFFDPFHGQIWSFNIKYVASSISTFFKRLKVSSLTITHYFTTILIGQGFMCKYVACRKYIISRCKNLLRTLSWCDFLWEHERQTGLVQKQNCTVLCKQERCKNSPRWQCWTAVDKAPRLSRLNTRVNPRRTICIWKKVPEMPTCISRGFLIWIGAIVLIWKVQIFVK